MVTTWVSDPISNQCWSLNQTGCDFSPQYCNWSNLRKIQRQRSIEHKDRRSKTSECAGQVPNKRSDETKKVPTELCCYGQDAICCLITSDLAIARNTRAYAAKCFYQYPVFTQAPSAINTRYGVLQLADSQLAVRAWGMCARGENTRLLLIVSG